MTSRGGSQDCARKEGPARALRAVGGTAQAVAVGEGGAQALTEGSLLDGAAWGEGQRAPREPLAMLVACFMTEELVKPACDLFPV